MWLPPKLSRELEQENARDNAETLAMFETCQGWDRELKAVDPLLELARAMPNADPANGLKPGFWHILRHNPGAPITAEPLEWPDGRPREPGGWMLDMLAQSDLWNERALRDRREVKQRLADAKQRDQQREAEARADELNERLESTQRESILFADNVKFKARAGARTA